MVSKARADRRGPADAGAVVRLADGARTRRGRPGRFPRAAPAPPEPPEPAQLRADTDHLRDIAADSLSHLRFGAVYRRVDRGYNRIRTMWLIQWNCELIQKDILYYIL